MWPDGDGPGCSQGRSSTGSEVVLDERALESLATSKETPTVSSLTVTKSSRVHIGPKFLNITQNVHNTEVVKGGFLGLELVSSTRARRMRCSVAVFVCWALVVATGLAFYLFSITVPDQTRLDIGIKEPWYLRRADWQAMRPYEIYYNQLPLRYVLVCHSATTFCDEKYECIKQVLQIQQDHLQRGFGDIGSNYLIAGNGLVFEGRGANVEGAMVLSWNRLGVSVTFLGDYRKDLPDDAQVAHFSELLDVLVKEGVLHQDYVIYGHCQVATHMISPGSNIIHMLEQFPHWKAVNVTTYLSLFQYLGTVAKSTTRAERLFCGAASLLVLLCTILIVYYTTRETTDTEVDIAPHEWSISRAMWLARPYNNVPVPPEYSPLRLVIIQHSVSQECARFVACAAELRNLQSYFINYLDYDIPYNFAIGNDGRVYEGRGWGMEGAHTKGFNRCALGIGFIGDYRAEKGVHSRVTEAQVNRTLMLLEEGVKLGFLHARYLVVGGKDLYQSESPGSNLYDAIRQWEQYDHSHRFRGMNCDQITAEPMPDSTNTNTSNTD